MSRFVHILESGSGFRILAGGVCICMFALTIGAQEITAPSTLLPAAVLRAIADEVSGAEAMAHVLEVVPYERNRPGDEYGTGTYREAAYMAAKAREYGFSEVTIERFPQEHPQWDGEAAELWVEEPVRKLITRYRDVRATLVPGSTSANVTAELVYVGPGNRESHYAGTEVKGKIVLASGPVRVVHDLAVRKFGAAGVASFHNAVGSPVERPDQIAWGRLTPVPADAEAQGAGPTTAFAFALSHRMGMELLDLLDKHRKVTVRAKVKATEHPVDLQVVVATIPGDGSIREPEKTEVVFCGHLFEGIAKQGANDNAAGPAVQLEFGRAWIKLFNEGVLPRPKRTIRFLWLPEFSGTRAYLERYPEVAERALAAVNFDMVGADQSKNKNRQHLSSTPYSLPSFLNDLTLQFLEYVAETNREQKSYKRGTRFGLFDPIVDLRGSRDPFLYQFDKFFGGSDHVVFIESTPRVPAVGFNTYHDVVYHTSEDSPFFLDPTQMKRAAFIGLAMGHLLANATPADGVTLGAVSAAYGQRRLAVDLLKATMMIADAKTETVHLAYKEALNLMRWAHWHGKAQIHSAVVMIGDEEAALGQLSALEAAFAAGEPNDLERVRAVYRGKCAALGLKPVLEPPLTDAEQRAARLVPRRTDDSPWAPLTSRGGSGPAGTSLGRTYELEARSFADGSRSILDIRNAISAEFGPVALVKVMGFFRDLEKTGTWAIQERPR